MTDAQVNQFITRLESTLNSSNQQQGSQITSLSQQITSLVGAVKESASSGRARDNAVEFVKVLNSNFDRTITQPKKSLREKPQKVYIAGVSGAASGMLGSGGSDARTPQGKFFKDMVDAIPVIGPALVGSFGIFKTIASFLLSPANLLALGGMGAALTGLYKVFQSDGAKAFLGKGYTTIRAFLEKTVGKFLHFITGGGMGEENVATFFDNVEAGIAKARVKINEHLEGISDWWEGLMNKFKESEWGGPIYNTAVEIIDKVKATWTFLFGDGQGSQGLFAKLGNFFGVMFVGVSKFLDNFTEEKLENWKETGNSFFNTLSTIWSNVKDFLTGVGEGFAGAFGDKDPKKVGKKVVDDIVQFVQEIQTGFDKFIKNMESTLGVNGIAGIMGAVGTVIGNITKSMEDLIPTIRHVIETVDTAIDRFAENNPFMKSRREKSASTQKMVEAVEKERDESGRSDDFDALIKEYNQKQEDVNKSKRKLDNASGLRQTGEFFTKLNPFWDGEAEMASQGEVELQLRRNELDQKFGGRYKIENGKAIRVDDFAYFPKTDRLLKFHPDDVISGKKEMPQSSNLVNLNTSDLTLDAKQDGMLTNLLTENNEKLALMIEELQQINQGVRETPPSVSVSTTQNNTAYKDIPASHQQRVFGEMLSPAGSLA